METKICGGRVKEWEASSKAKREGWRSANLATLLPAFFSSHVCVKSAEKISRFFSRTNIKRKANRPPQWEREWRERTSESSIEQNILCATRWGKNQDGGHRLLGESLSKRKTCFWTGVESQLWYFDVSVTILSAFVYPASELSAPAFKS